MKKDLLAASLLLSFGLSTASGGQSDPRFYGVWVGEETHEIPARPPSPLHAGQTGVAPVKKSAVLLIGDYGKTLAFGQGRVLVKDEVTAWWRKNRLDWRQYLAYSGRDHGTLVLSADGNTLTENAVAILPGNPGPVTCNITGTFHREKREKIGR
ncbi:MAG TPA: hypothetical protein VFO30_02645 [Chthoniobacterales bacterium]|nr:hypothetical protein [Chthoniobacterales bacterium]